MGEAMKVKWESDGRIFSGPYSREMWDEINNAKTVKDLRGALYTVCCRLQELESEVRNKADMDGR